MKKGLLFAFLLMGFTFSSNELSIGLILDALGSRDRLGQRGEFSPRAILVGEVGVARLDSTVNWYSFGACTSKSRPA